MNNVFITGGAGFLGRAFLRRLSIDSPEIKCTIFSRDHGKHSRCMRLFPQHRYVIGDVRDYDSVELAMAGHDTVIHMAAFKYVPEAEVHVQECHVINVIGSQNVARAAIRNGVDRVVGISTDKACQPINVYGMTKLLMERIFQEANNSPTQFNLVRYGNVVSSTGSAVPIFRRQAIEDGVIRLTNPDMTRFWLTVDYAVELIMMALDEVYGGTILIPRLPSLSILDVAKACAFLESKDVKYEVIGHRFGEKMHEDLLGGIESHYAVSVNDEVMRLLPMTGKANEEPAYGVYSSNAPDYNLDIATAARMIKEVPE